MARARRTVGAARPHACRSRRHYAPVRRSRTCDREDPPAMTAPLTCDPRTVGPPPETEQALVAFLRERRRVFVLTGAGCSTASGIPDYRDASGAWKHRPPVQYADFVRSASVRQRYWARSLVGYARMAAARPNAA